MEIKWDDQRSHTLKRSSYGLFVQAILSESCKGTGWNFLMQACLPVMDLIDWNQSHPDDIFNAFKAFGVDAAWKYFVMVQNFVHFCLHICSFSVCNL